MINSENIYSYLIILIAVFGAIGVARVTFSLLAVNRTLAEAKGEHKEKGIFFYLSVLVLLAVVTVGGYFGFEKYEQLSDEYQEKARLEAKSAFIKSKEWCLENAARIYNKSGYMDRIMYVPKYYDSCLKISKSSPKFCSELEPILIYSSRGKYFSDACRKAQIGEPGCTALFEVAYDYCAD